MKMFDFDTHIGDWRVLVQSRDIKNGSVQSRHITDNAVTGDKIGDGEVKSRNIATEAITGDKIENGSVIAGKIGINAVSTRNIQDGAVTPEKLSVSVAEEYIEPMLNPLRKKDKDLQNQIDSFNEHGLSVSNYFGDDSHIGVSQKTLTETFDAVWRKIEEITGEELRGFSWTVTPTYFISETAQTIEVNAAPIIPGLVFEYIAFYSGDTLLVEEENVATFSYSFKLTDTSVIKCVAKILGITYTREETVNHYNNFYLGAGSVYSEIMDLDHVIPVGRGAYNVTVGDNQYIFIIIGETLRSRFIRADINGVEIPFTESSVTVGARSYKVFTSRNTYNEGEYNIDING